MAATAECGEGESIMREAIYEEMTAVEPVSYVEDGDAEIESRESYGRELAIANRLAVKFGHDWAGRFEEAELLANPPTLAEIDDVCRGEEPAYIIGITSPAVSSETGLITHTTGTGRLTWVIWNDGGGVTFTVSRPSGVVLAAEVSLDEELKIADVFWRIVKACGTRHLEALQYALGAFGDNWIPYTFWDAARQFDAYEISVQALEKAQNDAWKGSISVHEGSSWRQRYLDSRDDSSTDDPLDEMEQYLGEDILAKLGGSHDGE